MNNSSSHSIIVVDIANIGFTAITWMLPDLPLLAKIIVSSILIGIMVVARVKPKFITTISYVYYLLLMILPILISVLEYLVGFSIMVSLSGSPWSFSSLLKKSIQIGITFGLAVGFPLALFGKSDPDAEVIGCGCLLQALALGLFFGLSNLFPEMMNSLDFLAFGFIGPFLTLAIMLINFYEINEGLLLLQLVFTSIIGFFFIVQLYQFTLIGVWVNKLESQATS